LLGLLVFVASLLMLILGDLLIAVVLGTGGLGVKVTVETELFRVEAVLVIVAVDAVTVLPITGSVAAALLPGNFQSFFIVVDVVVDDDTDTLFFLPFAPLASVALVSFLSLIEGNGKLDLSTACC
jgi:hypothetical protein